VDGPVMEFQQRLVRGQDLGQPVIVDLNAGE
jgi:hypothetical protein